MFLQGRTWGPLLLLLCVTRRCSAEEKKIWIRNKFTPIWIPEVGLSCSKDNKLTISDIVQLDSKVLDYASEIVLPFSRGLIEFQSSGKEALECQGFESRSLQTQVSPPDKWVNPQNWQAPDYVPHLERIPCWYEKVYLKSAFKLEFPKEPIHAGSIAIDSEVFTTSSSLRFFAQHSDLFLFSNAPHNHSVLSGGSSCPHDSGCECGNEIFRAEACGSLTCQYECSSGIKPKNHCCYNICGALIHFITYGSVKTKVSELDRIIRSSYFDKEAIMRYHISKVSDSEYEIILVNRNGSIGRAHSSAKRVEGALKRNFQDTSSHYIWTEYSGVDSASASSVRKALVGIFGGCVLGALVYTAVKALRRPNSSLRQDLDACKDSVAKQLSQWRNAGGSIGLGGNSVDSFSRFDNPDVELTEPGNEEAPASRPGFSFKELKSSVETPTIIEEEAPSDPNNEIVDKSGIENPGYMEVSLTTDEEKMRDRMGILNPSYEEKSQDDDKIRDRLGIDNPSYEVNPPMDESEENKIRDRLGLDNPLYGEKGLEEEEDDGKIRDRLGIDNPIYSCEQSSTSEGDEEKIRDRLGINNPAYEEGKDEIDQIMDEKEDEEASQVNGKDACIEFGEEEEDSSPLEDQIRSLPS